MRTPTQPDERPPARPVLDERPEYVPRARREQFIVPLLARHIDVALKQWILGVGGRVLDVGCGRQPFRGQLEAAGFEYAGMDAVQTPEGVVDFISPVDAELPADLLQTPPFDAILCTEVLEHVAGWEQAFSNFNRLLKPGGRILITAPHFYCLHEEPYDFWRPTPYAIRHFATKYGFAVLELNQLGDGGDVLGTLCASLRPVGTGGLVGRVVAGVLNGMRRLFLAALLSPGVRRRVRFDGPYFHSNLAVLEKK